MMSELKDKVIIVTGANRGIGFSIAALCASRGAKVALMARSTEAGLLAAEKIAGEVKNFGGEVKNFVMDITDPDSISSATKEVIAHWGKIDVLVNNAGITRDNLAMRMKSDDWNAVIDANLTGTFNAIKAVLRPMMKARSGSIINVSSVVASTGNPGQANYCAAKAGLEGLTRSLALEYSDRQVRVNGVAPGFIATDMTDALDESQKETLMEKIPLGRLGSGTDVAEMVAFLASDRAAYITGQVLHVNGGMYMN
jgi:3-oxoacyl-[acyl-carrier protein] reductase